MESQSMRRRQTVLGEQLQANASSSSQFLAVPTMTATLADQPDASLQPPQPPKHQQKPRQQTSSSSLAPGKGGGRHIRTFSVLSARGVPPLGGSSSGNLGGSYNGNLAGNMVGNSSTLSVPEDVAVSDAVSMHSAHLRDDDLDPELMAGPVDPTTYLSRALANASPADILKFGEKLRSQAQKAQESDQRKLQHSHKALSTVAANVAKLAPAVAELHRQVADLSLVSDAMRQDAFAAQHSAAAAANGGGASSTELGTPGRNSPAPFGYHHHHHHHEETGGTGGGGAGDELGVPNAFERRQSMLVLNPAWTNDLNEMYRRIDGAQRALPPAPGRHLVLEEHNWAELNMVTRKPVRSVLIVLLNDFLLVAALRHGKFAHAYHLELDETLECSVDDQNLVLRVGRGTTQLGLLAPNKSRLRTVQKEICNLMELASTRRRTTRRASAMRSPPIGSEPSGGANPAAFGSGSAGTPLFGSISGRGGSRLLTGSATGAGGHSRKASHSSVASNPEISIEQRREAARIIAEFDRSIAHRQWSAAVEQCLENQDDAIVGSVVAERQTHLVALMLEELGDPRMTLSKEDKTNLVVQLTKLGRAHEAKETLLRTAATDIETQARDVHFMGDVVNYISQMAAIYFQTIIATVQVYKRAFPDKADSSLVVTWVKSQVDLYAAIFNRQLFRIAPEFRAYQRCRQVSKLESSQLRELNMDMEFMLRYVWEN